MERIAILVLFLAVTTVSCSTKHIGKQPSVDLKTVNNAIIIDVHGDEIPGDVIDMLSRELKGQLILSGFDIADKDECDHINLNVDVSEFSPGNAALRITVGFGAGRGSLVYTAEYTDSTGKVLAKMDGQERFTGCDVGINMKYGATTGFGGADTTTIVLVKEAACHIVELATPQKESVKNQNRKEY